MKNIVIISETLLKNEREGVSLIVRNFINCLPGWIAGSVWSCDKAGLSNFSNQLVFHSLSIPLEKRFYWLLRIFGFRPRAIEIPKLNSLLEDKCRKADAIYIFSSTSSITHWVVDNWGHKTVLHLTDAGSVFARRSKNAFRYIRHRLLEKSIASKHIRTIVFVSEYDCAIFIKQTKPKFTKVLALPNGVDTKQFSPAPREQGNVFNLLFAGVMSYEPNHLAGIWICQHLFPLLDDSMHIWIVGMDPLPELQSLAKQHDRIHLTGAVDDMAFYYKKSDLFIAPMFTGSGIQNKILQALAAGLPVITSSICAKAFSPLPESILVADDVSSLSEKIHHLRKEEAKRIKIGEMARQCALENYSWKNRCDKLLTLGGLKD